MCILTILTLISIAMGANGSAASGSTSTEIGRRWKTVAVLANGMKVIELKDSKANHKAPEESRSPNSIYVMFNKDGNGIKSISKYDGDCKKVFEIHTVDHKGMGVHYHPWHNGRPGDAKPLTDSMKKMLKNLFSLI